MIEAESPTAAGQWLGVEDGEGVVWRVRCLGDPVEVGADVSFQPVESGRERRGELLRVLEAPRDRWVVRLSRGDERRGFSLEPFFGAEAPRMSLRARDAKGAREGDRVVVVPRREAGTPSAREGHSRARRHRGASRSTLEVRVAEVLGAAGEPDADHLALVWRHRLATRFSRRARLEADAIPDRPEAAELDRRLDLRALPFVTIDPATARDHDDAVFAEERPRDVDLRAVGADGVGAPRARASWARRLWVAIADVSHFVLPGSFIDAEARRRGNSFYFPDRALPMLPERLSSDLCSLRPDEDRLALVVELRIAGDGRVADALFHEAIVRSHARLAYHEAADWLSEHRDGEGPDVRDEPVWGQSLRCLARVADDLMRHRRAGGALELELPEIGIVLDEAGRPVDALLREHNVAHGLIEEAMLAANRAVAEALDRAGRPAIHRVHAPPDPRKLDALRAKLERHGLDPGDDLAEPGVLSAILERAREGPAGERLQMAALRSMSQACYAANSGGHYALRFDHYVHFTSPIRRYADLEVHRALKRLIRGERLESEGEAGSERAESVAHWLSGRERVAVEAERDAVALASCALMIGREGDRFEATVLAATEFGLFVRLDAPAVEGLVPMRALEGRWTLLEDEDAIEREGSRERIEVGDRQRVHLAQVDLDRARLAFEPVGRLRARRARDRPGAARRRRPASAGSRR